MNPFKLLLTTWFTFLRLFAFFLPFQLFGQIKAPLPTDWKCCRTTPTDKISCDNLRGLYTDARTTIDADNLSYAAAVDKLCSNNIANEVITEIKSWTDVKIKQTFLKDHLDLFLNDYTNSPSFRTGIITTPSLMKIWFLYKEWQAANRYSGRNV
jgi:hypothetical protein